jgi:hypothetical protein
VYRARSAGRWLLAAGVAVSLGRWPVHWRDHTVAAVVGGLVVVGLAVGVLTARGVAPLRAVAAVCLVDAVVVARAVSAHLPVHCSCVRTAGAPALAGWGGAVILADAVLAAGAVWLSRSPARQERRR